MTEKEKLLVLFLRKYKIFFIKSLITQAFVQKSLIRNLTSPF